MEPEEIKKEPAMFRHGFTLMSGWVVDADTGKPLQNVRIHMVGGRAEEQTNERGYYALSVPSPPECRSRGYPYTPGTGTLIAERPGYKTSINKNILLPDGMDGGINVLLQRGSGTVKEDFRHHLDVCNEESPAPKQDPIVPKKE